MIHHAYRGFHTAHTERLKCRVGKYGCNWPIQNEGEDGKCDWCRSFDERIEKMRDQHGVKR